MKRPNLTLAIVAIICVITAVIGFGGGQSNAQTEYTFAPAKSDFSVTFSAKPTIEDFGVSTLEGDVVGGVRAELRAADSFQRVEVITMPKGYNRVAVTKDDALKRLDLYAKHYGIQAPEFQWEVSSMGPKASMRGTKILDNNGVPTAVTYEAIAYYGETSLFVVYVGGISESYPTTRVVRFLNSVKRNLNKSEQSQAASKDATLSTSLLPARGSNFAKLKLPLGVSVEVPKNWRLLDGDINTTIETAAEAAMNLAGIELPRGKKVNLFRANSMPATTYAALAINATDSEINPDELKNASESEIRELSLMMSEMMQKSLSAQNLKVIEFYGVRREYVGKHPALVTEYKRTGPQGPVIVQMTRLFLGEKEISLNLSYRESEAQLWKPVIGYIRKSLTVR